VLSVAEQMAAERATTAVVAVPAWEAAASAVAAEAVSAAEGEEASGVAVAAAGEAEEDAGDEKGGKRHETRSKKPHDFIEDIFHCVRTC
jgi:hypothetical protein